MKQGWEEFFKWIQIPSNWYNQDKDYLVGQVMMVTMFDLEKIRAGIITLDESDAKSILMLTAANIEMVKNGDGRLSSNECIDQLVKIYNTIPKLKKKN